MKLLCKCFLIYLASISVCFAPTITFDDLPSTPYGQLHDPVPNGYGGLNWSNFYVLDGSDSAPAPPVTPPSAYPNAVVTPKNVIFNFNGDPAEFTSATAFNLNSAFFTAALNDGLTLEVQGFANSVLVYDTFYTLDTTGPRLITFDYLGVDRVKFLASGGALHPGYCCVAGTWIALDNLSISQLPQITNITVSSTILVLRGSGGPTNGSYEVISSPSATLPVTLWSEIATNQFDSVGNFFQTNLLNPNDPQRFYMLRVP